MPVVPASASVWHEPQFAVKIDFPSVGCSAVTPVPGDRADVGGDVLVDRLILILDAERVALDVVAARQRPWRPSGPGIPGARSTVSSIGKRIWLATTCVNVSDVIPPRAPVRTRRRGSARSFPFVPASASV